MLKRITVMWTAALLFCILTVHANASSESYVINLEGERQAIPLTYSPEAAYSYFNLAVDTLSGPTDIYIDKRDNLYILDAGNGRIIKLAPDGSLLEEYTPKGKGGLNKPNGLFVDDSGNMYVADTGNGRVVIFDNHGRLTGELVQPESKLFDQAYPFRPLKVEVDKLGQIYVINNLDYHGFTLLDHKNSFKGYLAATRLSADFWGGLVGVFASESQKQQLGKRIPPQHTNFTIAEDGSIYTTTSNVSTQQLKRYSAVGNNFYPFTGSFGDTIGDYIMTRFGKSPDRLDFIDVCVDGRGIASLVENQSGRIYQYDQDGNMIGVFGGTGNWAGRFMNAVAIENDSQGNLYVLDQNLNSVKVFRPTRFIMQVYDALGLYNNGKYIEAAKLWEEILKIDSEYPIAHIGMGKAELKRENFLLSMEHYNKAGDKYGYSQAFSGYKKRFVQENFLLIVLVICLFIVAAYLVTGTLYRRSKELSDRPGPLKGRQLAVLSLFSPSDAFYAIKNGRGGFALFTPSAILLASVLSNILKPFITHYPLSTVNLVELNLLQQIFSFALPFFLWVIGHYYVTCVFGGEIMFREVYATTAYALLPYALFTLPVAAFTNLVGIESTGFIKTLETILTLWVILLAVWGIKNMNSFTVPRTAMVIFSSIIAVLFIAVVAVLLYVLGVKFLDFAIQVFNEYKLLLETGGK